MSARTKDRLWFLLALSGIGAANTVARWPADLGGVHWADWFAFYFTPPISFGLILGAICWIVMPAPEGGRKRDVRLPLRGIFIAVAVFMAMGYVGRANADPLRSRAVRAEFQRTHPCPATGERRGACPGYEVDHKEALICGGRDELQNLQWLPVAEHREKTRVEVKLCRPRRAASAV